MPRLRTSRSIMHLAIASACSMLAFQADAQEVSNNQNTTTKAEDKKKDAIPEVIVTATRQATSLLKTPVAVTALKAEDLLRANAVSYTH